MTRRVITVPGASAPDAPIEALTAALTAERKIARRVVAKRERLPKAVSALEATLFPKQAALVFDSSKRISCDTSRRGGKSHALIVRALRAAASHPGSWVPIINRTTTSQSALLTWRGLQELNDRFSLQFKFHHTLFTATAPNRSRIQIAGADTTEAWDKLRGEHPPEVIIDEAGTHRPHTLEYGMRECMEPALMDYQGTLVLAGTPGTRRVGPFAEACGVLGTSVKGAWSHHHWTFEDNDALPLNHQGSIEERRAARLDWFESLLRRYGWTRESPHVKREYLGLWEEDSEGLIYRLAATNHVGVRAPDLTHGRWCYGLGIDFGYDPDPTAFVVVAWLDGDPRLWVLESYEAGKLIPSVIAAHVERLRARYSFEFIVADTGGAGKFPAEEMRQRYDIPVLSAKKRGKEAHVAFVNGDLASGTLLLVEEPNRDLVADLYALRRAEGEEWAEDSRDSNHLPDALLYAATHQRGVLGGLGTRDPDPVGSNAWLRAREREWEEAAEAEARPVRTEDAMELALEDLPNA